MKRLFIFLVLLLASQLARAEIPFLDPLPEWIGQYVSPGFNKGASAPTGCSTFSDNFSYTGTLPNPPWTISTASGYTSVSGFSGTAASNPSSTKAMAVYTAATSGGDQCSQFTLSVNAGALTGPGVLMSVAGTGYDWHMAAGEIDYLSGGGIVNAPVTSCFIPSAGDVVKLTYTVSTGVLAAYSNGSLACSGTDTLNPTVTSGYPSILFDGGPTAIASWIGQ